MKNESSKINYIPPNPSLPLSLPKEVPPPTKVEDKEKEVGLKALHNEFEPPAASQTKIVTSRIAHFDSLKKTENLAFKELSSREPGIEKGKALASGNFLSFSLAEKIYAKIPENIQKKLEEWLTKKTSQFASSEKRISYTKEQIPAALQAFQKDCHCNWRKMKEKWAKESNWIGIQIINDLRGMILEEDLLPKLQEEFPGVEIIDCGSDDLTSDRDLSLKFAQDPSQEVNIVARFNNLFESEWGVTSAKMFDCNAYTNFYIECLSSPDKQQEQLYLQSTMSQVMLLRTGGFATWEVYKNTLLAEIAKSTNAVKLFPPLKRQFARVEWIAHDLGRRENEALVRSGAHIEGKAAISEEGDLLEIASKVKVRREDLAIKVTNTLHDTLKTQAQATYVQKNILTNALQAMKDAESPDECLDQYQKGVAIALAFQKTKLEDMKQEHTALQEEIHRVGNLGTSQERSLLNELRKESALLNQKIKFGEARHAHWLAQNKEDDPHYPTSEALFQAVKDWDISKKKIALLRQQISEIESLPLQLKIASSRLLKQEAALQRATTTLAKQNAEQELVIAQAYIEELNWRISTSVADKVELQKKLEDNLEEVRENARAIVDRFDGIVEVLDQMQIAIEIKVTAAMCFAQEAHVSANAVGFTVLDIQAERANVRGLGDYLQAANELLGFYVGHQAHQVTPQAKMIEVSKYIGPRLMEAVDRMEDRAKTLGIEFPKIENRENVKNLFIELLALRKKGIDPKTKADGLNSVADAELAPYKKELLGLKSKAQVNAFFQEKGITSDKLELVVHYFTDTETGGVSNAQQEKLANEIGAKYFLPVSDNKAMDTIMIGMLSQLTAWTMSLHPNQLL